METPGGSSQSGGPSGADPGARLVYVLPQYAPDAKARDEVDLFRLWRILWGGRWLIVGVTAVFALGSAVYAYFLTPIYSASVVLAPVRDEPLSGLAGQLGGLASIAALAGVARDDTDAVAVLRSRDFIRGFIEEQALIPVLFPDAWDEAAAQWTVEKPPDLSQATGFFVSQVRTVEESANTGLVTLTIEWRDAELAAEWANLLAVRLNEHMRNRALTEAESNVKYLRHEFENTSVVTLQQSISDLLENEMQKLMLARGNSEYAFRIIDRAEVPKVPSEPRVVLIVAVATVFGAMLAAFVALVRDMVKTRTGVGPAAS
jgi:uncharacterized protein involved in exopolysaccharide biosynthesis